MSGAKVTGVSSSSFLFPSPKKLATITVAIIIIASLGYFYSYSSFPLNVPLTWKLVIGCAGVVATASIIFRKLMGSHESSAVPKNVERMFSETVQAEILSSESSSSDKELLQAMIKEMMTCRSKDASHTTMFVDFFERVHEEARDPKLCQALCMLLCRDQSLLLSVTDSASCMAIFFRELIPSNEAAASEVISFLREKGRLIGIFSRAQENLFFLLAKFLIGEELVVSRDFLSPDRQDAFDEKCLEILREDSPLSQIDLSDCLDQIVKYEDLSSLELAVFNSYRRRDRFTPIHAIRKSFESLLEEQLARAFGMRIQTENGIVPWMSEKLVADLISISGEKKKCLSALKKGKQDAKWMRTILYNILIVHEFKHVFASLDEQMKKEILLLPFNFHEKKECVFFNRFLICYCKWAIKNEKLDAPKALFDQMDINAQITSLILLFKKNHNLFKAISSNLTIDQWIGILTSQFWLFQGNEAFRALLQEFCLAHLYVEFVRKIQNEELFNTLFDNIKSKCHHLDVSSEYHEQMKVFAAELHRQGKLEGTLFKEFSPNSGEGD